MTAQIHANRYTESGLPKVSIRGADAINGDGGEINRIPDPSVRVPGDGNSD